MPVGGTDVLSKRPPVSCNTRIMQSNQRILDLEGELRQCRQECEAAQKAERQFRTFSERVKDYAFITFDAENRIVSWSRGAEQILGYTEPEILGQLGSVIFTPEDRRSGEAEMELAVARSQGSAEDERWHLRRDGTRFWGSGLLSAHRDIEGNIEGYSKVMRDLTARVLAEQELRNAEERFQFFADNVTDYALVQVDTAGNVSGWNSGAERTFGYTEKEIIGRSVGLFFTPEDREQGESEKDLERALTVGRAEDNRWMVRRDGSRFWSRWVTTPMRDGAGNLHGFAKILRDETERKQAEDLLNRSVHETELLLREIHHRIKNNLHVITSLLSLQASQLQNDPKMQSVLDELQNRVRAIAALHETLYSSQDLANIDFGPYLRQLVNELVGFSGVDKNRIQIVLEADDIVLSNEQALPLGLIANELVSNTLKHAFAGERQGTVAVHFRYGTNVLESGEKVLDTNSCELSVRDTGVGITDVSGFWERGAMGLRIIQLLTKQLHGTVTLDQTEGTRFFVRFPLQDIAGKIAPVSTAANPAKDCFPPAARLVMGPAERPSAYDCFPAFVSKELKDVGVFLMDENRSITSWSVGVGEILGYSETEFIGRDASILFTPEDCDAKLDDAEFEKARLTGRASDVRWHMKKDGSRIFIDGTLNSLFNDMGSHVGYGKILRDITPNRVEGSMLKAILDCTPDSIYLQDQKGRYTFVNSEAARLFGRTIEEVVGHVPDEFLPSPIAESLRLAATSVMEKNQPEVVEERLLTKEHGDRTFLTGKAPWSDTEGKVVGVVSIAQDISGRKLAEEERERLVQELSRSNDDLAEFAHVVSHDLQAPLRMIHSYAQLLERRMEGSVDQTAGEFISIILDGAQRMEDLIAAVLRYAQAGHDTLAISPVRPETILEAVRSNLQPLLKERAAKLIYSSLPTVAGDPIQLLQLFQNLVSNALKYARPGIPPRVCISAEKADHGQLRFEVRDNGLGIDPKFFQLIFTPLRRLHGQEIPGTGIGLSLCRKIVERHGGRMWLTSELGKGSSFCFTLPCP